MAGYPKKYAAVDKEVVDYGYYQLLGTRKWFRGPPPPDSDVKPVTFLGAASCFGRFVRVPYASLTTQRLGMPARNLGYGGARARFYSNDALVIATINKSSCAVLELFSARGTDTSRTEAASEHSARLRWSGSEDEFVFSDRFFSSARNALSAADFADLIREIRENYIQDTIELLQQIKVPKIVLWLSQREPDVDAMLGEPRSFPHFVDGDTVHRIASAADAFVSVVSKRGIPSRLTSLSTGAPVEIFPWKDGEEKFSNDYYPSPEMHEDAADTLVPVIADLVAGRAPSTTSPLPPRTVFGPPPRQRPGAGRAGANPPKSLGPQRGQRFLMLAGCPRSGTSALHRLLNMHPRIALGLERFNIKITNRKLTADLFAPDRFFDLQQGDTWYKDFSRFEAVYERLRRKYNRALYVGDKYPRAYSKYDFLAQALAGCRFIYIVRDIVSVAKSYEGRRTAEKNWPATRDARVAVQEWNEGNQETLRMLEQHPILVVAYDSLFKQGQSLASMGRFLELDLARLESIRNFAAEKRAADKAAAGSETPRTKLSAEHQDYIAEHADMETYHQLLAAAERSAQEPELANAG